MKRAWKVWGIITALIAVGTDITLHSHQALAQEAQIFRATVQSLKKVTNVPVRLPSQLPNSVTRQRLYVSSQANANGYSVLLESHPQCARTNACYVGSFHAQRGGEGILADEEQVQLVNGITGSYQPLSCGGSCTPPTIKWIENGVLYSIQMRVTRDKAEAKREMIQLAKLSISEQPGKTANQPQLLKEQADRYYANNEYQQAIAAYSEAIRLSPRYASLYYNRGVSYHLIGKNKEAIADLQKAAQLYQEQGKLGDYRDAIDQIATIQKKLPSNSSVASQSLCKFVEPDRHSIQGVTIEPGQSGKDFKKLIGTYTFAVDKLNYRDLDSGARVLSFDVFNLGYANGVIEVRDAQGKLVECRGVNGIKNQDNVIDFGIDSIKRLYRLASEGYGFMDPRNSLGNSEKTEIRNILIPPGGTLKFTKTGNVALRYNQAKTVEYVLSKTDSLFKKGDPSLKVKLLSSFMAKFEAHKVSSLVKDGGPITVSEAIKGAKSIDWVDQTELKKLIDISKEVLAGEFKDQLSDPLLSPEMIGQKLNISSILAGYFSQGASMYLQWYVDWPLAQRVEPKTQQIVFVSKKGR